MDWMVVAVAVSWAMLVVVAALCYLLATHQLRQNGRMLLTVERLERILTAEWMPRVLGEEAARAATQPPGLAPGTLAPAFDLPSLDDPTRRLSLGQFLGRRLLLAFFRPDCGHCDAFAPKLARLPIGGDGRHPALLVLSTGTAAENEVFRSKHGLRCPVALTELGTFQEYGVNGTPMANLIDEQGQIASDLLVGGDAILAAFNRKPAKDHRRNGHDAPPSIKNDPVVTCPS